jgi:hypothetical protein
MRPRKDVQETRIGDEWRDVIAGDPGCKDAAAVPAPPGRGLASRSHRLKPANGGRKRRSGIGRADVVGESEGAGSLRREGDYTATSRRV